jgi:hypothetical protein
MAMSSDSDLTTYQPDILGYGISAFTSYHAKAQADIERELRSVWYPKTGYSAEEMDEDLLTESQFARACAFRVLGWYALPQLTKWNTSTDKDKFQNMMDHYRSAYFDELDSVIRDGVEYDANEDSTISVSEKRPVHHGRLFR